MAPREILWCVVGMLALPWAGFSQLTAPEPRPILGARMPALSPDGKRLAFVYRGDIWMVPARGGRATPLTQHIDTDAFPVFSPDGQWVAFASKRTGNWDIFAVPAEGGPARQLTWHSGADIPQGWSPDGKYVLFAGRREAPNYALYALDVNTLRSRLLCEDYAPLYTPNYSPDGKQIVYGRYGLHWTRPRYQGSAAQQIWLLDPATGHSHPLTTNQAQHLWTRFLADGRHVVTVTVGEPTPSASPLRESIPPILDTALRTPNLWVYDLQGVGQPLTSFIGGSVRFPTVAARSGDIAFEYGADLYLLPDGASTPQKIEIVVAADEKQTTRRREKLNIGVTEAELSPDGKTFAFGLRGDIWTIATEKPKGIAARSAELAKQLTDWVGDDSDFSWSPDGKKLYFTSDREFTTRLYELDLATMKSSALWNRDENLNRITVSPDGKQLGFWVSGKEGGLYTLTLENSEVRRVVSLPGPQWHGLGGGDFAWSPDMRWIAYSARSESKAWNIYVVPGEGGTPVNVTRLHAMHSEPAWSPDGKYLYFQSAREGEGLYVLPLRKETVRSSDTDLKFEKPKTNVTVEIDFTDISQRIRRLASQSPRADLTPGPDGTLFFISEGDIWSVSYDGKDTRRLTSGGGKSGLRLSKTKASYLQNGELFTMGLDGKGSEKVTFTAEWERDVRAERRAAFTQFWNGYQRGFYDANFHGRDWAAIRSRYEPLLEGVETHDEFATLLHMMVGELETSHAEVSPASIPGSPPSPVTPQLGCTFDYAYEGPGLKVRTVPAGTPGSYAHTAIQAGDIILAVNGQDVALDERLYQLINDKQDREFEFLVSSNADRRVARTVRYKVMTDGEWTDLNYRNRTERLRKHVEEESRGKIGYLHLAAMSESNQLKFEREAYEYMAGKEAMIIDVRFNVGGNISDTLIDWIERKPHGFFRPRDAEPETAPYHAWEKRCLVLMNEHSYSNGEMFPNAMRTRGLARLVGMPTPGYVIWTTEMRLIDGTGSRMPQSGVFRMDGSNMENNGEQPDVRVPMSPEDWLAGRDPQLDKAIELLIGSSASDPVKVVSPGLPRTPAGVSR
ncbi:MAG TPA: S41 family peptidase [Candidatus Saccharimonadales bacterium]|nr:S41 family peptidase [Candidatus Saccharimonadales bacterium]